MANSTKMENELEHCLSVIACVITHHGDEFWPLYMLIEEELEAIRMQRKRLTTSLNRIPNAFYSRKFEEAL